MAAGKGKKKSTRKKTASRTSKSSRKKQSRSAGASFMTRAIWGIVLLVILVAALFYFTGHDPREILPEEFEQVLEKHSTFSTPSGPSPSVEPSSGRGFNALLPRDGELSIIVLDVGQGNAVFVQTPGGKTMLVDTGESAYYQQLSAYLTAMDVQKIDLLVGTHPHSDHIGGMAQLLRDYEVDQIYMPRVEHSSNTYIRLLEEIRDQGKKIHMARGGRDAILELDPDVSIQLLAPLSEEYSSLNNYSIVLRLEYMDFSMLLTADAEKKSEGEMLETLPGLLPSTVLLLGHHGSSTSNTEAFLDAVSPTAAIISCGKGNDYGHPHDEILSRLKDRSTNVYRTDEQGSIGVYCGKAGWEIITER